MLFCITHPVGSRIDHITQNLMPNTQTGSTQRMACKQAIYNALKMMHQTYDPIPVPLVNSPRTSIIWQLIVCTRRGLVISARRNATRVGVCCCSRMSVIAFSAASSAGSGTCESLQMARYDFCLCSSPCFSSATMARVTDCIASDSTPHLSCTPHEL